MPGQKMLTYFQPGMLVRCFLGHFKNFQQIKKILIEVQNTKFLGTGPRYSKDFWQEKLSQVLLIDMR